MHRVLIAGAGNIGSLAALLLAKSRGYYVYLADNQPKTSAFPVKGHGEYISFDATNMESSSSCIKKYAIEAVVSALPYYHNINMAKLASLHQLHYFDLTEDVATTDGIHALAHSVSHAFVPQCGLAPGFINIMANHLMKSFSRLDTVKLRVGALPANVSNALQYALTWSTEGLINEYGNRCAAIENGKEVKLLPLEGLEEIIIDGLPYEAFNTSGGIGSLADTYRGRVNELNYKTIRYPGHCAKMKFLMNDLQLNLDRNTLKHILENRIPKTYQDVVLTYVSVSGLKEGVLMEENIVKKFYPAQIDEKTYTAIQLSTASALCAAVDFIFATPHQFKGFVKQEQFSYDDLIKNRFGQYYQT